MTLHAVAFGKLKKYIYFSSVFSPSLTVISPKNKQTYKHQTKNKKKKS